MLNLEAEKEEIKKAVVMAWQSWKNYGLEPEDYEEGLDIRLQVLDGTWQIHTGDSQYDTDHRGIWGYGWLGDYFSLEDVENAVTSLMEDLE